MEDFIVWDEDNEKFIDETKCIFMDGTLFRDHSSFLHGISADLTMFKRVEGIETIDGKPIYRDCTIFEFKYEGDPRDTIEIGYFSFNKDYLFYEIRGLNYQNNKYDTLAYCQDMHKISNIKAIDTIQENKRGLIK